MDVSDRRMQVQLTPEAKIASDFLYIRAIFAVVGFVSALSDLDGSIKAAQTVDKPRQRSNFLKEPEKPKGKSPPHVEYKYINTTRKKTRR